MADLDLLALLKAKVAELEKLYADEAEEAAAEEAPAEEAPAPAEDA